MAVLNLTGQQLEKDNIQPKINKLNQLMQQRKPIWDKATFEQKEKWVDSGKDFIMSLAWTIYKHLHKNFFGGNFYDRRETK